MGRLASGGWWMVGAGSQGGGDEVGGGGVVGRCATHAPSPRLLVMARVIGAEGGLQLAEKGGRTLARQPEGVARGVAQHLNGSLAARLAAVPSVERNQAEVVVRLKRYET